MGYRLTIKGDDAWIDLLKQINGKLSVVPFGVVRDLTTLAYRNIRFLIKWGKHVRRGTYYKSIKMKVQKQRDGGGAGVVYSDAEHALYIEEGTKPHLIVPRHAKALRFKPEAGKTMFGKAFRSTLAGTGGIMTGRAPSGKLSRYKRDASGKFLSGGGYVFAKVVRHPGTVAYRIFRRGVDEATSHMEKLFKAAIRKISNG